MANPAADATPNSEPAYAKNPTNVKLPWWNDNIDKYLLPGVSELPLEYSKIPEAKQSEHVHKIVGGVCFPRSIAVTDTSSAAPESLGHSIVSDLWEWNLHDTYHEDLTSIPRGS